MIDPVHVQAYAAQAALFADWIDAADATRPSRLPGWDVAHLAAHVAVSGQVLSDALARPRPPRGTKALTLGAYLAGYADVATAVDERARSLVARGLPAAGELRATVAAAVAAAGALDGADPVVAAARGPVRASVLLRTRVLELVVHALDADDGPSLDRQAVRVSCRVLTEVLAERHPGRSVEVRVPPYAAVQIGGSDGGGPVHTRGTPPNVVECAPEAFVAVASGRRAWAVAVAAGDVRASGLRADLSAYLPVL